MTYKVHFRQSDGSPSFLRQQIAVNKNVRNRDVCLPTKLYTVNRSGIDYVTSLPSEDEAIPRSPHFISTPDVTLLAVPLWIVERAREPKTHSAARLERGEINEKRLAQRKLVPVGWDLSTC